MELRKKHRQLEYRKMDITRKEIIGFQFETGELFQTSSGGNQEKKKKKKTWSRTQVW